MKFSKSIVLAVLAIACASPMGDQISPQITKNCEEVDQMVVGFVMQLGHLTVQVAEQFVSSLTKTIESTVSSIENFVAESGNSHAAATLIAPFVNSIAKGSGYLVSALANNPNHLVNRSDMNQLVSSLKKMSAVAAQNKVDTHEVQAVILKLNDISGHFSARELAASDLMARSDFNPIWDAIKGGVTNVEQTIETLAKQVGRNDGHPAADAVGALITGLDSQIDNLINMFATALGPLTFGVSNLVGDAILGPVFQSLTNGAEVVLSNLVGGTVDLVTQPVIQLFVHTLSRAITFGKQANVKNLAGLQNTVNQLNEISKKAPASAPKTIAHPAAHTQGQKA